MTRARERLLLSGAVEFERWPKAARQGATTISWLGPALAAELPALAAAGQPAVHDLQVGTAQVRLRAELGRRRTCLQRGSMSVQPPPVPAYLRGPATAAGRAADRRPAEPLRHRHARRGAGARRHGAACCPRAGGIATLSYTSLSEFERCGYRYYLERVLGMAEQRVGPRAPAAGAALEARARGTLVHALLESRDFRFAAGAHGRGGRETAPARWASARTPDSARRSPA